MNYLKAKFSYFAGGRRIKSLLGILIALVVSDGVISKFLVTNRFGIEGNPFLLTWVGEETLLVMKVTGAIVAALLLWDIHKQHPKLAFISSLCLVVVYTGIIFWNLFVFFIGHT